jgi:aspartate racemase
MHFTAQAPARQERGEAMKVIGLIGGMSWNSSLEYYRLINEMVAEKLGGLHSARIILYSLDFDEVVKTQHDTYWDDAAVLLGEAGVALKRAGADFILICTNTMHKVADAVAESAGLPLLDICDITGKAIKERGLRRVGLLGSRFVMEEPFYRNRLQENFGIELIIPDEEDRVLIHEVIFGELCRGEIKASSRLACIRIIDGLLDKGAEGIILGCTELPLLIRPVDVRVPLFDTTRLHAEAAVKLAFD